MYKFIINNVFKLFMYFITAISLFIALDISVLAQEDDYIPEIDIRATIRREELQSTSATILENKDIYDRHYFTPSDILKMSPGISIRQGGNFGTASAIRVRGFSGAHAYGGQLLMTIDGIPIHDGGHADGYIDAHVINPLEIESVEIIKGPSSVYYGRHAEGGVAAFQTVKFGDFTRLRLVYGSDNSKDAAGVIARQHDKFGQVYSFQFYQTDGWKDNTDAEKYNFSARWSYRFSDSWIATLNLRAFRSEWNNPGATPSYLPKKTSMGDGSGQYGGGKRNRGDIRFWTNYLLNEQSQFTFYAYYVDMDSNMYGKSWAYDRIIGSTNNGYGGSDQQNNHRALGTGLMYNYKSQWGGHDVSATLGVDFLREKERRDYWELIWGSGRAHSLDPNDHKWDHKYVLDTLSLFGEINYQIINNLKGRVGLRYDSFGGKIDSGPDQEQYYDSNLLGPNQHLKAKKRTVLSPKAGLVYTTPLDWLDIYTNYGRGFGLPYMETAGFFVDPNSGITKRDQWEIGFRATPSALINFESVFYYLKTKNDIIFTLDENGNESQENGGETKRAGIETAVNIFPYQNFRISGNFTYQIAEYEKNISQDTLLDLSGHRLTGVPTYVSNIEIAYEPSEGFGARLSFNWNTDIVGRDEPAYRIDGTINTRNPVKYYNQSYGTFDGQISYRISDSYRFVLDAVNILNKEFTSNGTPISYVRNDPSHHEGYFNASWMQPLTVWLGFEGNW
jgi:iron complex outermembrane receptor protein